MVSPGMLQNPAVRRWLGDIIPAWTLLDDDSFAALHQPPSLHGSALKLSIDLTPGEIAQSAVARNALVLLHAASVAPGLKLTTTGNLSRQVVAEMWEVFFWPDFDKEAACRGRLGTRCGRRRAARCLRPFGSDRRARNTAPYAMKALR